MRFYISRHLGALLVAMWCVSSAQAQPAAQAPAKPAPTAQPLRKQPAKVGPGVRAFRDMRGLTNAARKDSYTRPILGRVRDDRVRTIDSKGVSANRIAERAGWVPLGADPELRRATVATVLRKIGQKSDALQKKLATAKPEDAVWDVVLVGAGVHTAIVANTIGNADDGEAPTMLTIEGDDVVAGNFRKLGSTVSRNSANRAGRDGESVRRGFGDKNPSSGPWSDPDLSGLEYPEVGILADTATVNLFSSGSDFLMRSRVDKIEEQGKNGQGRDWPARYRVTTSRGNTVYTNTVVVGTGLGKPRLPQLSANAMTAIEAETAKFDLKNPDAVPKILTYEQALTLANLSKVGRDPYRAAAKAIPKAELKGLRVKTNPPARLEGLTPNGVGQALNVPLEDVADFAFDTTSQRWKVTLSDGKVVETEILNTRADTFRVAINANETLQTHADRLGRITLGKAAISVNVTPVTIAVKASVARDARFAKLTALAGNNKAFTAFVDGPSDGLVRGDVGAITDAYLENKAWVVTLANGQVRRASNLLLRAPGNANYIQINNTETSLARTQAELDLEPAPRPVVAVVGGGDGGRTFLEYLYGQAPESAYQGGGKHDTAQRGDVGDVVWVVGQNGPADCANYLQTTRSRYLKLTGKFRPDEKGVSRAQLVKANLADITQLPDGKYQLRYANNVVKVVDRIIFATGYENQASKLVGDSLEPVKGTVPNLAGERVLAKRATGQDIFLVGPAAGTDVVGTDEVFATKENAASLYAFAPRDAAVGKQIATQGVRALNAVPQTARAPRVVLSKGESSGILLSVEPSESMTFVPKTSLKPMLLKAELEDTLREFRVPGLQTLDIKITGDKAGGVAILAKQLDSPSLVKLRDAIEKNPLLVREIVDHLRSNKSLEIRAPLRPSTKQEIDGIVRSGSIQLSY